MNPGTEGGGMVTRIGNNCLFMVGAHVAHDCQIGDHVMIGGKTGVADDVIPYGSVIGNRARLSGLNIIGLKRRDFSRDDIHNLRKAYRLIFAEEGTMSERLQDVAEIFSDNQAVMEIVNFIQADSSRAICQPKMEDAA